MGFSKEDLQKLRQELPRGSARKIALKLNLAEGTVKNALGGHNNNESVVLAAMEIIEERQAALSNAHNKISAL